MGCDVELLVGSTNRVQVALSDPDTNLPLSGQTVALQEVLDELANVGVSGFSPPLAMPEIGTTGTYRASLPGGAGFVALRKYVGRILISLAGGATRTQYFETFAKSG